MTSLKFGTSGLRGLVEDLVGWPSFGHTTAFLGRMATMSPPGAEKRLILGQDLRPSSPEIARACAAAAAAMGWRVEDCGPIPTPALALESLRLAVPAIMITGSHIPDDRNGLKFYSPRGEIDKADEEAIAAGFASLSTAPDPRADWRETAAESSAGAVQRYAGRYVEAFGPHYLAGLRVGVYQHSTVARDLIVEVLQSLGATPLPFARSDTFIPVDTEAHRPEDVALLSAFARDNAVDAIVSADGDADRPLVADANGRILRGDALGLLTAGVLGVAEIVTPVTSSSAIEVAGAPARVRRTRVGSPFVIAEMHAAVRDGAAGVVGFEANGGVLLGTDIVVEGRTLAALPTRDALLPIIAALGAIRRSARPLAEIVSALRLGSAVAGRLQNVPGQTSGELLKALSDDRAFAKAFLADIGDIDLSSTLDGVRLHLSNGEIVHYRASGNAPELRCYVEAATERRASELLDAALGKAGRYIHMHHPAPSGV